MSNQYVILGIAETATDNEIRRALKNQIEKYCGRDNNGKTADGNYLQSIFLQAAKDLLDPKKRARIDTELQEQRLKNGVIPFVEKPKKEPEQKREVTLVKPETSKAVEKPVSVQLKREIVKPVDNETSVVESPKQNKPVVAIVGTGKIQFFNTSLMLKSIAVEPMKFFDKSFPLQNVKAVIGEDGSFMFVWEASFDYKFTLKNLFTNENIFGNSIFFNSKERPYMAGKIFQVDCVQSICITGSKFIPVDMIEAGCISITNIRRVSNYLSEYFARNSQIVQSIFGQKEDGNYKTYYAQ